MDIKFGLDEIEKTFTNYRANEMVDGVVISINDNGIVFNLGGKLDAFIPKEQIKNFEDSKIGDRFPVIIMGGRNEDGMILASKILAENLILGNQNAENIKLGSSFTCVITGVSDSGGLISKLGQYSIYIPENQICSHHQANPKIYVSKQVNAVAIEINVEEKKITASISLLDDKIRAENESNFWRVNFINKIVDGTVKTFVPYGAFVEVDGIDCLLHISEISHDRIISASEVLELGKTYKFKIIKIDRENKRVSLSYKQLQESNKTKLLNELKIGDSFDGKAVKILQFGAIIRIENGLEGLLHIKNATDDARKQIFQIVKLGETIKVNVKNIDLEKNRLEFSII
ncbi:MAG: S1 RNA-binding domain-containing protein [Clostridia bacterium]|nr:S1 RNA-binding domain-containing protein [Clostridia bacterium]